MSDQPNTSGLVSWLDLTVPDAEQVRDFYEKVAGWSHSPVSMGDYDDYAMLPPGGSYPVAGICHARGANAALPAQWMIYITVDNLEDAVAACQREGGSVLIEPKTVGGSGRYCVIKDPAGAVAALFEHVRK